MPKLGPIQIIQSSNLIFLLLGVLQIINKDKVQEGDREANGYIISGGIVVILHGAEIPDGSIL